MSELLNDIKKSPEYLEANNKLNKLRKKLDSIIESYDNGAITENKLVDSLWMIYSELNTTYYTHSAIFIVVPQLNKKHQMINKDILRASQLLTTSNSTGTNLI